MTRFSYDATHTIAEAQFAFRLGSGGDDAHFAPLLCAGLIGWRSLKIAGEGNNIGLYGFGAAAHIIAQVARWPLLEFAGVEPANCASSPIRVSVS